MVFNDSAPILLYTLPSEPDETRQLVLTSAITCIGRLQTDEVDPPDAACIQFPDDLKRISRRHARLRRDGQEFILENWEGSNGIGLYEHVLSKGERRTLASGDTFRIPASGECVRLQFLHDRRATQIAPFWIETQAHKVFVYGQEVGFTPQEYRLLEYLYERKGDVCNYRELVSAVWNEPDLDARKSHLDVLLHDVRRKIRTTGSAFTFMETVRGVGIRMVL